MVVVVLFAADNVDFAMQKLCEIGGEIILSSFFLLPPMCCHINAYFLHLTTDMGQLGGNFVVNVAGCNVSYPTIHLVKMKLRITTNPKRSQQLKEGVFQFVLLLLLFFIFHISSE